MPLPPERLLAWGVIIGAALVTGCTQAAPVAGTGAASSSPPGPHHGRSTTVTHQATPTPRAGSPAGRGFTAAQLEAALRVNPNEEARSARCRAATSAEHRSAAPIFGATGRQLFVCRIELSQRPAELYYVPVLPGGCFTGERERPAQADWGCIRR